MQIIVTHGEAKIAPRIPAIASEFLIPLEVGRGNIVLSAACLIKNYNADLHKIFLVSSSATSNGTHFFTI